MLYGLVQRHLQAHWLNIILLLLLMTGLILSWQWSQSHADESIAILSICLFTSVVSFLLGLICSSSIISSLSPRQDKRLLPLIGAGATGGGIVGGLLVIPVVSGYSEHMLFMVIAAIIFIMTPLFILLHHQSGQHWRQYTQATQIISSGINQSLRKIIGIPLLKFAVIAAFSIKAITLFVQYLLMQTAQFNYADQPGELAIFFGNFYLWVSVITLIVQLFIVNRVALRFGILPVALITPVLIGAALLFYALEGIWAFVIVAAITDICTFTFYKASQGMSFTPFSPGMRKRADIVTTGIAEPAAVFFASLILVALGSGQYLTIILLLIGISLFWLYRGRNVRRLYIQELENALLQHSVLSQSNKDVLHDIDHDARQLLLNKLRQSNDATEIEFILAILHEHHSKECLDVAVSRLVSQDEKIRQCIYRFLANHGEEANAMDVWSAVSREQDIKTLITGISAMLTVGHGSMAHEAAKFTHHPNPWIRVHVMLASYGANVNAEDRDMLLYQIQTMSSDEDETIRQAAAYYLAENRLGITESLERLIDDPSFTVREQAFHAIAQRKLSTYIGKMLLATNAPSLIAHAATAIQACGKSTYPAIDDYITSQNVHYFGLLSCIRGLAEVDTEAGKLAGFLAYEKLAIRAECAHILQAFHRSVDETKINIAIENEITRCYAALTALLDTHIKMPVLKSFFDDEINAYIQNSIKYLFVLLDIAYPQLSLQRALLTYTSGRREQQHVVEYLDSTLDCNWKSRLIILLDDLQVEEKISRLSGLDMTCKAIDEPWLNYLIQFLSTADTHTKEDKYMLAKIERLYHLKQVPFLSHIPSEDLLSLTDALEAVSIEAQRTIFSQGDPPDYFYIIVSGEVDVILNGEVINTLGSGDAFGEIAVLNEQPRSTTISTRDDCNLLRMSKMHLSNLLEQYPQIARGVIKQLAGYVQKLTTAPQSQTA